jgi:hypothetical protein
MRWYFALAAAAFACGGASSVAAQEGRWVVRADDRAAVILDLRPDAARSGGWRGEIVRPERMTIATSAGRILNVGGPLVRRSVTGTAGAGGSITLEAAGRGATPSDHYVLSVRSPDVIELAFAEAPAGAMPPLRLARARAGEEVAAEWDASRSYRLGLDGGDNAEMQAIFDADQAARNDPVGIDWSVVGREDAERRRRTRELLDAGGLKSGTDFYNAAFVFQHGEAPNDYLLAHSLAVAAVARERADASWIAAATLDRYLQSIGQKQIFGTQFRTAPGQPTTQDPYDRALVPDALRTALGVPVQAEQETQRKRFEAQAREREARQARPQSN